MSKFDSVLKKISEALPLTPQQQGSNTQSKPAVGAQPQVTPQQQKQALEQFAQAMGVDAAELQKAVDTLKQQQQKTASTPQQQTNQPAA